MGKIMLSERDRKMNPYFPSNRDDENDFYEQGFNDARRGWMRSPPIHGKQSCKDTYELGYTAGKFGQAENA